MDYVLENEKNNFKNDYPLVFYFLQQKLKTFKYRNIESFKQIFPLIKVIYFNPFQSLLFHIKLYLSNKCSVIQTYYLYLTSLASFFIKSKFQFLYHLNNISTTITTNTNEKDENNFINFKYNFTFIKSILKNNTLIIISIIVFVIVSVIYIHYHYILSHKLKILIYKICKKKTFEKG